MTTNLLNVREVALVLAIGRSTVWRYVKLGLLPQPIKLSAGATRWRRSDIEGFINGLIQESEQ